MSVFHENLLKCQGHLKVKVTHYQGQVKGNHFSAYCKCFGMPSTDGVLVIDENGLVGRITL